MSEIIAGTVEKVLFKNDENGYVVFRMATSRHHSIGATGYIPDLVEGASVTLTGTWSFHPKFGRQFVVEKSETAMPQTALGIEKYLGSGLIKGIGPTFAKRLVSIFGAKTLEVIDKNPELLERVPGVGPKRIEAIANAWKEQREIANIMVFLQSRNVSTTFAAKMYKAYGSQTIDIVTANPYRIVDDIWGVGFKTADTLAQKLGYPAESILRVNAGILHALSESVQDGNLYTPLESIYELVPELLELPESPELTENMRQSLTTLVEQERVLVLERTTPQNQTERYATLPQYYYSEFGIARRIKKLLEDTGENFIARRFDIGELYEKLRLMEGPIILHEAQQRGILSSLQNRVSVITGGPGTGKTTLLKTLLDILVAHKINFRLAAPTGRAAKRMFEGTGRPTETIHRMLGFAPHSSGFTHNEQNKLVLDFLIIDEASMIDVFLMFGILKALPDTAHLVLLGDIDQLPSVGAGNILNDIIASGVVPVTRLTEIFRQAQDSLIITNAHRVNRGEFPHAEPGRKDFIYMKVDEPEDIFPLIRKIYTYALARNGIARDETVVLTPMNRGIAGTVRLNEELQMILNEANTEKKVLRFGQELRCGDRVMQIRNNYEKFVFNGDMGFITDIDTEGQKVTIEFQSRALEYQFAELNEITLAYAISIHKSQGSEFDCVIIPIFMQHFMLLQRNLIYTAITRAKKMCILVGQPRAIAMAVKKIDNKKRITFLADYLSETGGKIKVVGVLRDR